MASQSERGSTRLLLLWARMKPDESSSAYPQFVGAFCEGEVDAWPESYRQRRMAAEAWFAAFGGEPDPVDYFFTTWIDVDRPEFPSREEALDCV